MNTKVDSSKNYFGTDLESMHFAKNYHDWITRAFTPYLGEHAAEVGAGCGSYSDNLLAAGVKQLVAFEPSSNMYQQLESKFSKHPNVKTINAIFQDHYQEYRQKFDSVVYVNVLEHIENDLEELEMVHTSLKDDGHVLIFVPALSWLYGELDRKVGHFRRYHKKPLNQLVKDAGFDVIFSYYFDVAGILPWYVSFVLFKAEMSGANVQLYDRWVVPIMSRVETIIKPPLGKNILLVAKKGAN